MENRRLYSTATVRNGLLCVPQTDEGVKAHVPVTKPETTPYRPEHSIATMPLGGRNKHGGRSSGELCHKKYNFVMFHWS
ncbi:jg18037 [Pararge aegeria aegeria]|uniref:Jg18037 protein n=1 Tax=Pararge aegeria aegeria TaxID=348720 RepID=A0A8S4QI15_9NEOP|nr:jg18037 [Pararge aegeria aegeria]